MLAEIGDDSQRFADARGLKAYAGSSLFDRMLGQLYYCLQQNRVYDGSIAFGEPVTSAVPSAA